VDYSKNINNDKVFNAIHDGNSLQQAQITETEMMFSLFTVRTNDQQQLFRPLVNSTID